MLRSCTGTAVSHTNLMNAYCYVKLLLSVAFCRNPLIFQMFRLHAILCDSAISVIKLENNVWHRAELKIFSAVFFYLFDLFNVRCWLPSVSSRVYCQINFLARFGMLENVNFYGLRTFSWFTNFMSAVSGIPGLPGISLLEHLKSSLKIEVTNKNNYPFMVCFSEYYNCDC